MYVWNLDWDAALVLRNHRMPSCPLYGVHGPVITIGGPYQT
jgi:hypothetical protein